MLHKAVSTVKAKMCINRGRGLHFGHSIRASTSLNAAPKLGDDGDIKIMTLTCMPIIFILLSNLGLKTD